MLGRYPLQKLNHGLAVNKPGTDWYNCVSNVLATIGIRFAADENASIERPNADGSQWNILLPRSLAGDGDGLKGKHHFKIELSDETHVRVLGGSRIRDVVGAMERVPVTGDAGDAPTVDLFKTVTISASVFVWLEFDDALAPAALTVNTGAAYPDPDNASEKLVLGHVTFAAGAITGIEQYWTGGDWRDEWIVPESRCLDYNADNKLQLRGWNTASSVGSANLNNLDLFNFQDNSDNNLLKYISAEDYADWIEDYIGIDSWVDLNDTVNALGTVGQLVTVATGPVLDFVSREGAGDGIWWKLNNTELDDAYGAVIGRTSAIKAIDLTLMRLHTSGAKDDTTNYSLDWSSQLLRDKAGSGYWSVEAGTLFKVLDTTDISAWNDLTTAALQCRGGASFDKKINAKTFFLNSRTGNEWSSTDFKVDVTNWVNVVGAHVQLNATAETTIAANTYVGIVPTTYLNLNPGGQLQINGTPGATQAVAVVGKLTLDKGIATAMTTITPAADNTYSNPTSITILDGHITAIS